MAYRRERFRLEPDHLLYDVREDNMRPDIVALQGKLLAPNATIDNIEATANGMDYEAFGDEPIVDSDVLTYREVDVLQEARSRLLEAGRIETVVRLDTVLTTYHPDNNGGPRQEGVYAATNLKEFEDNSPVEVSYSVENHGGRYSGFLSALEGEIVDPITIVLLGGIGCGKSTFLYTAHRALRQANAGISIKKGTFREEISEREHTAVVDMRSKSDVQRANATSIPDEMVYFGYANGKVVPFNLVAPGAHMSTLDYEQKSDGVVYLVDTSFIEFMREKYYDDGFSMEFIDAARYASFKQDTFGQNADSIQATENERAQRCIDGTPHIGTLTHRLQNGDLSGEELAGISDDINGILGMFEGRSISLRHSGYFGINRRVRLDLPSIPEWFSVDLLQPRRYEDVLLPLQRISQLALEHRLGEDASGLQLVNFSTQWEGPQLDRSVTLRVDEIS
jgi:hypothetical protein